MSNSATLSRLSHAIDFRSERASRLLKATAFALAAIYAVNGAGAAAGYANQLPANSDSSAQQIADMVQVGVSWPVVLHDIVSADDFQRIDPVSKLGT